jgi:hypothetical protein
MSKQVVANNRQNSSAHCKDLCALQDSSMTQRISNGFDQPPWRFAAFVGLADAVMA